MSKTTRWIGGAIALACCAIGSAFGAHFIHAFRGPNNPNPDGTTTLPNGWKVSPAGSQIDLPGDMPLTMLLSRDGKYLLVNTAGYHDHSLNVIELASQKCVQSVELGNDWAGMCLSSSGDTVYLSAGGEPGKKRPSGLEKGEEGDAALAALEQPVLSFQFSDGKLVRLPSLAIDGIPAKKRFVSGLAIGPDDALYALNIDNNTLYRRAAGASGTVTSAPVGKSPFALAFSPDSKQLAVSNWADQTVSLIDPASLTTTATIPVGSHPNQLAYGKDGRLYVANSGSNSVSVIRDGKVAETVKTSLNPDDPVGSTPDALTISPDGQRLYVANADNNDVAVIDISNPAETRVLGFVPTGWYPSALAVSADGRQLYVGTAKGLESRPNNPTDAAIAAAGGHVPIAPKTYIPSLLAGHVAVVPLPDAAGLAADTEHVRANVPKPAAPETAATADVFHKIKHVVYIIRENRTYDQVLGDMPQGNGDSRLCLFPQKVTPNAHALANNFVLLDNLYCNGEVSEDGHQWCDAAYATDFTEKHWPLGYSGRPDPDDDDLSQSPAGYLWDDCARHGLTYRTYGERSAFTSSPGEPPVFKGPKTLDGHANYDYAKIPWFGGRRDLGRADIFIKDMKAAETAGDWPQFMIMCLPEDHTQGLAAGDLSPDAHVGENDEALGRIVDAVSHSKFWQDTAIFVIEDDAQNGPDHVDAHRTVGLVISPYIKHGVDSTMYSTASFVRAIELILGLPPMTQYDAAATPLYNSFQSDPSLLTAYNCLPAQVDLDARNPAKGAGAVASAALDLSAPDRADPDKLNAILWHALRPNTPMPAPVRSPAWLSQRPDSVFTKPSVASAKPTRHDDE